MLDGAANCQKCHEPDYSISAAKCLACHQPIAERMAEKRGVHREITGDCEMCHPEHGGRDADLLPLDPDDFDHAEETGFALVGRHAAIAKQCKKCHTTRSYLTVTAACSSCHEDPHQGNLGRDCATCHAPTTPFRKASRAFHKQGLFPLQGRHLAVPCADCHWDGVIKGTPTRCFDCHWIRRQDDPSGPGWGTSARTATGRSRGPP